MIRRNFILCRNNCSVYNLINNNIYINTYLETSWILLGQPEFIWGCPVDKLLKMVGRALFSMIHVFVPSQILRTRGPLRHPTSMDVANSNKHMNESEKVKIMLRYIEKMCVKDKMRRKILNFDEHSIMFRFWRKCVFVPCFGSGENAFLLHLST